MANIVNSLENEILDGLLGITPFSTSHSGCYLALFTADPTDSGSVADEVTGANYSRLDLSSYLPASVNGKSVSSSDILFPAAGTGGWGNISHIGIMKSGVATTDDMMLHGMLSLVIPIADTEVFQISTGNLSAALK